MDERRKITRWQVDVPAQIRHEAEEECFSCRVKDISFKGLSVVSKEKLTKDACVKLQVSFEAGITFKFEAWVCWHKGYGETNCYGMYFTRIDDATKEGIFRFIKRNMSQEVSKAWFGEGVKKEGGEKMEDKRIFERFEKKLPLRFLDLNLFREGSALTRDISAKGVGFNSDIELKTNTPLELWVDVDNKGEPLYARGQVAWSQMCEGGLCRVGVNLEKANLMGLSRILRTI